MHDYQKNLISMHVHLNGNTSVTIYSICVARTVVRVHIELECLTVLNYLVDG